MPANNPTIAMQRELVERWRETGRLLQRMRYAELAAQPAAESQRAAYDMLQLGGMLPANAKRERSSGLLEMQRLFARWQGRGRA